MNCKKCGNLLAPTDMVCGNCGEPVNAMSTNQGGGITNSQAPNANMNFQGNMIQGQQNLQMGMQQQSVPNMEANPNTQQAFNQFNPQNLNSQPSGAMPMYNQNVGVGQAPNQNYNIPQGEKKNNLFIIVAIILVAVIGVLGYFVVSKKLFNNNGESSSNPDTNGNNPSSNPSEIANTDTYNFKDFEFPIPKSYQTTEDKTLESLQLVDNANRVVAMMFVHPYLTIDDYKEQLDVLKSQLSSEGVIVNSDRAKTISGVEWVILDCSTTVEDKTLNVLESFASLGNYHIAEIMIVNLGNKDDDTIFNEFSDMINKTTYKGTSNFASDGHKETPTIHNNFNFDESIFEE